ncbi:MAG: hypothetical protein IKU69_02845, partial [Roseburia sp.]|nr:hypothetical protein [Roseburia sp.]
EHIPGSGNYGTYTDYDGNEVSIDGIGLTPYYMWNITDGLYFNVYYGANFVDYVGYVEDKLTMICPINGVGYDSFIYNQYFDLALDGATAADKVTVAAINAINAIPEKVSYEQKALVEKARELYTKIATTEQQALVTNYADLISAEQRITALAPGAGNNTPVEDTEVSAGPVEVKPVVEDNGATGLLFLLILMVVAAFFGAKNKEKLLDKEQRAELIKEIKEKIGEAINVVKAKIAEIKAKKAAEKAAKEQEAAEVAETKEEATEEANIEEIPTEETTVEEVVEETSAEEPTEEESSEK